MRLRDVPDWFAEIFVALAEAYPAHRVREAQVRVYYAVLAGFSQHEVQQAFTRAPIEYPSFFPSAGDLRKLIDLAPEDKAIRYWTGLQQAASSVGAYQELHCDDGAVVAAVLLVFGSWPAFCEQCTDIPSAFWAGKRQEFIVAYRAARQQPYTWQSRLDGALQSVSETSWSGRLLTTGEVVTDRPKALTARAEVKELTEGDLNEES